MTIVCPVSGGSCVRSTGHRRRGAVAIPHGCQSARCPASC